MRPWSMLPTWWYPGGSVLPDLRGGASSGESQATLRVFLALATAPRPAGTFAGAASLSDLQDWSEISRSMVLKGIRGAVKVNLIGFIAGKQGQKSTYHLIRPEGETPGGWAKLPNAEVLRRIPRITHRGDVALAALKIYMTLIAARPNNNVVVALKHETLRTKTGCQTRHVRPAISLLAIEGLLQVRDSEDDPPHRVQRYALTGPLAAPRRWNLEGQSGDHDSNTSEPTWLM